MQPHENSEMLLCLMSTLNVVTVLHSAGNAVSSVVEYTVECPCRLLYLDSLYSLNGVYLH